MIRDSKRGTMVDTVIHISVYGKTNQNSKKTHRPFCFQTSLKFPADHYPRVIQAITNA